MLSKRFHAVLLMLVLAALPSFAAAQHRLVVGGAKEAFVRQPSSPLVMRERSVALDLPALAGAAADRTGYLEIAFFDDAVARVLVKRTESTLSGGTAYSGQELAQPLSSVVVVNNRGTVAVMAVVAGRRFSIQGSGERGYIAREEAASERPAHPPAFTVPPSRLEDLSVRARPKPAPLFPPLTNAHDDGSTIDVLVVYTPAGRRGDVVQMNTNVDLEVMAANDMYASSGVAQRLRLVYRGEVAHTERTMEADLDALATPGDGVLDEVQMLRDLYSADFVSLWGNYSSYCGIGFMMSTEGADFAPLAYNVVASNCTGGAQITFAHELGHNMGLRHDSYMDPTSTFVTPEAGGGLTEIPYAHGYVDLLNRFRTVMSYRDQCSAQVPSFFCRQIPFFSNPTLAFDNTGYYPTAIPAAAMGDPLVADERQVLNDTRETTANFRRSLASSTGPGFVTFMPTTYTVAESGTFARLTVGRHVGSIGTITVNYTSAPGTATPGSDFDGVNGTLTWIDGDTSSKTIIVHIVPDAVLEGPETFTVTLSAPTGGAVIVPEGATATVTIVDDDPDDVFPGSMTLPAGFTSPDSSNANTPSTAWSVDPNVGFLSTASLRSARVYADTYGVFAYSDLEYTANFQAGSASFVYRMSSYHQGLSGFEFQVDGITVFANEAGGEVDWTFVSQQITPGLHTLRWRFRNALPYPCGDVGPAPPGGRNCADRVWVDNIALPALGPSGPFPLVVTRAGNGTGTIASSPAGVDCGNDCANEYAGGTAVTLTATPAPGSSFAGWSGGGCSGAGACTLTLNAAASTTATFNLVPVPTRLSGISTRVSVQAGDNMLIAGFIIGGSTPKTVVINARGPSLASSNVAGPLANPFLTLVPARGTDGSGSNDNWGDAYNAAAIQSLGFAPPHPQESSIMATLAPGAYTALVGGWGGTVGVGMVEVFEVDHPEVPLTAISTRGLVQRGDGVMIAGFVIQGDAPQAVVVRARGPSLGIAGALADPTLTLVPASGPPLTNDDWGTAANAAALSASGFAPANPKESAILVTLEPGAYTAIVSGAGLTTGVAIVEVFKR